MPTDEEILQEAYYVRDLINYSNKTKELTEYLFDKLRIEQAIVSKQNGDGYKLALIRNVDGEIVGQEKVYFTEQDYQRRSGMVEALGWLEEEVQFYLDKAKREDDRKAKESENKGQNT